MKYTYILFVLLMSLYSCKTPENISDPTMGKALEMQPETNLPEKNKEQDPVDLKSLFKQMALTEPKKEEFLLTYRLAAKRIAEVKSLKLDFKDDQSRVAEINEQRDNKIKSILDIDQNRMYLKYLRNLAKRKIINQSDKAEINY